MRIPYLGLRMNQQVATLPTRLNLGCGSFKKPGFLNVDIVPEVESDLILYHF
jgi:hypothetical protein